METIELIERIKIQKAVFSYFYTRNKIVSDVVKILSLLLPAIIAFISISDLKLLKLLFNIQASQDALLIISLISFVLFILSVLIEVFSIEVKSKLHRNAINRLAKLKQDYKQQLEEKKEEEKIITTKFMQMYYGILENSPEFTDKQFLRGKKYYLKILMKTKRINDEIERNKK
jgi:hypothetical protein